MRWDRVAEGVLRMGGNQGEMMSMSECGGFQDKTRRCDTREKETPDVKWTRKAPEDTGRVERRVQDWNVSSWPNEKVRTWDFGWGTWTRQKGGGTPVVEFRRKMRRTAPVVRQ